MTAEPDPCAVLAELEQARRDWLTGKTPRRVRFRGATGTERELETHKPDMASLDAEIRRYRDLCAIARGRPARFAATGG